MTKELIKFSAAANPPSHDRPRPDRLVRGNPLRTTWNQYEHAGFSAGEWACEVGAWNIAFADGKDEFFHVLEGRIRISDAAGTEQEFGPGEAGVIPAGFTGLFEVIEPVRKRYVISERESPATPDRPTP